MEQEKFIKRMIGKNMGLKLMYITNNPAIAEIAECAGVDRIFIDMEYIGKDERQAGLDTVKSHHTINDVKRFMFELLADGTVDRLCKIISEKGIPYGFGGIARLGYGELPAEYVITEHYRLGSTLAILSRSFCNANKIENPKEIENIFKNGIQLIRDWEQKVTSFSEKDFQNNRQIVCQKVNEIVEREDNCEKKI